MPSNGRSASMAMSSSRLPIQLGWGLGSVVVVGAGAGVEGDVGVAGVVRSGLSVPGLGEVSKLPTATSPPARTTTHAAAASQSPVRRRARVGVSIRWTRSSTSLQGCGSGASTSPVPADRGSRRCRGRS